MPALSMLASRWWTLSLRGLAAVVFGILTLFSPGAGLFALVVLFGCYAIVNGILDLAGAVRRKGEEQSWGAFVVEGLLSIVAGALALLLPGITALVLLYVIAAWAVVTGISQIAAAVRLRKHVKGEWLLALTGVLSVAFGVLLLLFPGAGALALAVWIGAWAIVVGALLFGLSLRLRTIAHRRDRQIPTGGMPEPAKA